MQFDQCGLCSRTNWRWRTKTVSFHFDKLTWSAKHRVLCSNGARSDLWLVWWLSLVDSHAHDRVRVLDCIGSHEICCTGFRFLTSRFDWRFCCANSLIQSCNFSWVTIKLNLVIKNVSINLLVETHTNLTPLNPSLKKKSNLFPKIMLFFSSSSSKILSNLIERWAAPRYCNV